MTCKLISDQETCQGVRPALKGEGVYAGMTTVRPLLIGDSRAGEEAPG